MDVVAVAPLYPPHSLVGSWLATHELLRGLHERGHRVTVYRRLAGCFPWVHDGIEVRPGRDNDVLAAAIGEADLVVSHLGDDNFAHLHALAATKPSIRLVHSLPVGAHGLLEDCALAVFNSEATRVECGWSGPQIVAHPPLRFVGAEPGDRTTLINLSAEKGGELFWRLARKRSGRLHLGVMGGWGFQIEPRSLPIRPLDNVEITDPTPRIGEIYRRTRVLLVPSESETWGMAGVEAMSCGIPVVAHPTPGLRESLADAGIFADREDEAAWLDAIDRLDDPTEWVDASRRALARAAELAEEHSAAQFADAVESLVPVAA